MVLIGHERASSRVRLIVPVVALVLFAGYVQTHRVDPAQVPQTEYWRVATHWKGGAFERLPTLHPVVVPPPKSDPLRILASHFARPFGEGAERVRVAEYDPNTGTITIVDDQPRFEASLPRWLQVTFVSDLRHEYGHALLYDWLAAQAPGPVGGAATTSGANGDAALGNPGNSRRGQADIRAVSFPKPLRPVVEEFSRQKPAVYGDTYFTSSFDEYMAESYARLLASKRVPVATRMFLLSLATVRAGAR